MDTIEMSYDLGGHSGVIFITCDHTLSNDEVIKNVKLQLNDELNGLPFGIHEFNIIDRHPIYE
jgi:hypothetical protein